jgi:hypothetical protein
MDIRTKAWRCVGIWNGMRGEVHIGDYPDYMTAKLAAGVWMKSVEMQDPLKVEMSPIYIEEDSSEEA